MKKTEKGNKSGVEEYERPNKYGVCIGKDIILQIVYRGERERRGGLGKNTVKMNRAGTHKSIKTGPKYVIQCDSRSLVGKQGSNGRS